MRTPFIEILTALEQAGVNVVRARAVDSPEDAIAFAERREASDPRFMPIVLRADSGTTLPLDSEKAIRRAYERLTGAGIGTIVALNAVPAGETLTIVGESNGRKTVRVQGHTSQEIPLDAERAALLAAAVRDYGHRLPEKTRRMLEHLFLHLSAFFEAPALRAFTTTVRLHDGSYTVVDAAASSSGPLHVHSVLGPHARDRKSTLQK
jgi:hypothetical protein